MASTEDQIVRELLGAYRQGVFPMADLESGELAWYSADPRAVVPIDVAPGAPGGVALPRSLRSRLRSSRFEITSDEAFERVMRACAQPRSVDNTGWIDERMIALYTLLHRRGHAHSVEAWVRGSAQAERVLVGGLYGVHIGGAFFGESMFCRPELGGTDSSKVCFIRLVQHLRRRGFVLLDTQFANPHMERLGIHEIPRREYLRRLKPAIELVREWGASGSWGPWIQTESSGALAGSPAQARSDEQGRATLGG